MREAYEAPDRVKEFKKWFLASLSFAPSNCATAFLLWFVLPGLFFCMCALIVVTQQHNLPTPIYDNNKMEFSEGRARQVCASIFFNRTRLIGTKNNEQARDYIVQVVQAMKNNASVAQFRVEIDLQPFNYTVFGAPLYNIFVRISDATVQTYQSLPSVLVSSHYDSVFPAIGAVDDGAGTCVMLEMIYNFLHQPVAPVYPLVFLFNNGEERGLLGAKAALVHPWYKLAKRVINMDGNGVLGKSIMFRAKPDGVVPEYAVVPYPHSNVFGEEVIEYIPNDTDFTIYSRNDTFGFDIAAYVNGYSYHTMLDAERKISPGGLQMLGENSFTLAKYLSGTAGLLEKELPQGRYVFFDFLGLFFVYFSEVAYLVPMAFVAVSSVFLFPLAKLIYECLFMVRATRLELDIANYRTPVKKMCFSFLFALGYLLSWIAGIVCSLLVALLFGFVNRMTWYTTQFMAYLLFAVPCFIGMVLVQWAMNQITSCATCTLHVSITKAQKQNEELEKERYSGQTIFWGMFCFLVLIFRVRALYMVPTFALFYLIGTICLYILDELIGFYKGYQPKSIDEEQLDQLSQYVFQDDEDNQDLDAKVEKQKEYASTSQRIREVIWLFFEHRLFWIGLPFVAGLFGALICADFSYRTLIMIVPILGYANASMPDIVVAALISIFCGMMFIAFLPLLHRAMNFGKLLVLLTTTLLVVFIIALFLQPYSAETPKRLLTTQLLNNNYTIDVSTSNINHVKNETIIYLIGTDHGSPEKYLTDYHSHFNLKSTIKCTLPSCTVNVTDYDQLHEMIQQEQVQVVNITDMGSHYKVRLQTQHTQTRFAMIQVQNANLYHADDAQVIVYDERYGYFKYGYDSTQWIVDIVFAKSVVPAVTFVSSYCESRNFATSYLNGLLAYNDRLIVNGVAHCNYLSAATEYKLVHS